MRVAILLALLAIPHALVAQQSCKASPDNAAISGVVRARDSFRYPDGRVTPRDSLVLGFSLVHFPDLVCRTNADRTGRYSIAQLPAGNQRVIISLWGVWLLDTIVTLHAGATLNLDPRLRQVPDPLMLACPEWPTCDRLPPDTSLNTAAVQTLLLLAESEQERIPLPVTRCLSVSDSTYRQVGIEAEWLRMSPGTYSMSQCSRNSTKQYLAPGGAVSTGLSVERKPLTELQPWVKGMEGKALYFLTAYHPPLLISTWSCWFERRGPSGWRAAECAPPLSDH